MESLPLIRRLEKNDVKDYREIRLESLHTNPEAFGMTYEEESAHNEQDFIIRITDSLILGAYFNNKLVGTIEFQRNNKYKTSHKGTIWGFYVKQSYRSLKIGEKLIEKLIILLKESNVKQISLSVVEENVSAIYLYKKMGFGIYGKEPMSLKADEKTYVNDVLMCMII
ncbi:GNAT family N-acetyltransferase [Xenorhabdus innexi]|uniref:Protease synthase and sporulation negative regulatory protein pai 1 n=1 Tax=Xenorhabdus innexi TaxID=290109 RepID=A0A1N6MXS0_9GAMM|nr:GNAT family N-acetyltransferase [Xenorhabdus innexi]PHM33114.1 putative protease synthase and sporulation negative regulatory protein pai 1 [Xenorhabdus innexi]SIP73636.1 putative GCN5-related N-acetyltransferase [Xenorhabdus innexi]